MRTIPTEPGALEDGVPYFDQETGNIWVHDGAGSRWVLVAEGDLKELREWLEYRRAALQ